MFATKFLIKQAKKVTTRPTPLQIHIPPGYLVPPLPPQGGVLNADQIARGGDPESLAHVSLSRNFVYNFLWGGFKYPRGGSICNIPQHSLNIAKLGAEHPLSCDTCKEVWYDVVTSER
jgi:hypothetical protein